jgi:two-component system, NtrC family, response regulator AtoC
MPDGSAGCDSKRIAFEAVSSAFGSLGRVCLALNAAFEIAHVSPRMEALLGPGVAARYRGRPVEELLGPDLLGPSSAMRAALEAGERREGWRAWLRTEPAGSRLVSVSAAPLDHVSDACDPDARYLLVLRAAEEDPGAGGAAPTSFSGVIARSQAMVGVMHLLENLQHSDVSVLITGESGVGKGVVAHALHASSSRRARPFVAVNCAALPDTLLESELFGHVRGAFTGAVRDRVGRFELAHGGTIFLDEIGDIPLHLQAKLLRVIQERTFERVGDSRTIKSDVRIVAATHRDLRRGVAEGRFREDLYYRLRVFPIEIPPLRERPEDIEPLARQLLARVGARSGRALRFSPCALRVLLEHPWPGNVRELENAIEYAATVALGQTLQPEDLPPDLARPRGLAHGGATAAALPSSDEREPAPRAPAVSTAPATPPSTSRSPRGCPSRAELLDALTNYRWHMTKTACHFGVSRTTLWRWLRAAGISC